MWCQELISKNWESKNWDLREPNNESVERVFFSFTISEWLSMKPSGQNKNIERGGWLTLLKIQSIVLVSKHGQVSGSGLLHT